MKKHSKTRWTRRPQIGDVLAPFKYPYLAWHEKLTVNRESVVIEACPTQKTASQNRLRPDPGVWEFKLQRLHKNGRYNASARVISALIGDESSHGADRVCVVRRMKRVFV
jgi:hypothetical protein